MKCLDFSTKKPVYHLFNRVVFLLLMPGLLFVSAAGFAVEVEGLYQGTVVVQSRDNERERQRAFTEAFGQVLLKVTGNSTILNQANIRRALSNADDYVDTWSYRSVLREGSQLNGEEAASVNIIELNITFFEPEVLRLLDSANIPFWPGNRPYTLVWLVLQDELGTRRLLGSSNNELLQVRSLLEAEAQNRALPLLLPILDFEDMRALTANDVWDMNTEKVLQASQRYQSESVLLVRLFRTLAGDVLGKSSYLFRGQVLELEMFETPVEVFVRESVALATDEISAYYAVLLSGTDSSIEVNLTVEGIADAADYAALLDYVARLTDVNDYQVSTVENQTITLRLSTGGQIRQLIETIALNRTLLPVGDLVRNDNQVNMNYQWNN